MKRSIKRISAEDKSPLNDSTLFRMAFITKPFTAVAIKRYSKLKQRLLSSICLHIPRVFSRESAVLLTRKRFLWKQMKALSKLNEHLYEGRYSPRVGGKRISRNVYAKTREECEEKLAELIKQMKAELKI